MALVHALFVVEEIAVNLRAVRTAAAAADGKWECRREAYSYGHGYGAVVDESSHHRCLASGVAAQGVSVCGVCGQLGALQWLETGDTRVKLSAARATSSSSTCTASWQSRRRRWAGTSCC